MRRFLEFHDGGTDEMVVRCRSTKDRPCGRVYPSEEMIGWHAIRSVSGFKNVDDVTKDERSSHVTVRNIAALQKSCAGIGYKRQYSLVLSIDYPDPYAFFGKVTFDIAIQLGAICGNSGIDLPGGFGLP